MNRIQFDINSLSLLYEGEPRVATLSLFPETGSARSKVEYLSLNESVATVTKDKDGNAEITPIGVGQTHIKATYTAPDNTTLETYLCVNVDYLPAQFQLVASGSPKWTQTIGDFSEINFTLYVLGDHIDPDPEIEWYIGTERVIGKSNLRQYSHLPTATTGTSYQIAVRIRSYKQEAVWLYSNEITILE